MVRGLLTLFMFLQAACLNGNISSFGNNSNSNADENVDQNSYYNAILFDGTNDYTALTHSTPLDVDSTSQFTVEMWIRPTGGAGTYRTLWAFDNYIVQINSSNQLYLITSTACGNYAGSSVSLPGSNLSVGSNHHVAFVRSAGAVIYICADGTCGSLQGISQLNCPSPNSRLGARFSGVEYFTGYMDEFRISNNARYPGGGGYTTPTSAFYWDINTRYLFHANYPTGSGGGTVRYPTMDTFTFFNGAFITSSPF